jgi:hypothetical protein
MHGVHGSCREGGGGPAGVLCHCTCGCIILVVRATRHRNEEGFSSSAKEDRQIPNTHRYLK